ncbi:Type I restriction-modification system, restriction subunit R [Streptococcus mitis]|nr:Type I restriction-modification system, restriction subunit R [Streptococcus mitis]
MVVERVSVKICLDLIRIRKTSWYLIMVTTLNISKQIREKEMDVILFP